jgi:hypothetical protein
MYSAGVSRRMADTMPAATPITTEMVEVLEPVLGLARQDGGQG